MDFRRIMWVFLAVFIALDLFLAMSWIRMQQPVVTATTTQEVLNEMKEDGISFEKPSLNLQYGTYYSGENSDSYLKDKVGKIESNWDTSFSEGETLTAVRRQPLRLQSDSGASIKQLEKMLRQGNQVIDGKDYRYDSQLTEYANSNLAGSKIFVFSQKLTRHRQFSTVHAQIRFIVNSKDQLVSYTQTHVSNIMKLRDETQLISEEQALTVVYQYNELPNNSQVKPGKISYTTLTTVDNDTIYIPVWSFGVKDASGGMMVHKVNAINGTLLK